MKKTLVALAALAATSAFAQQSSVEIYGRAHMAVDSWQAGGTGTEGYLVPVEAIPAFGADDASAAYSVAGARTGAKITTQNQVTSMTITAAWNSADAALLQIRADGYSGSTIRTYVIAVYDGEDTVAYSFNARVGGLQWDMAPNAEGKFMFHIHPTGGNSYGWSNNT